MISEETGSTLDVSSRMTTGRAALLALLGEYAELSWLEGGTVTRGGASPLEIQPYGA